MRTRSWVITLLVLGSIVACTEPVSQPTAPHRALDAGPPSQTTVSDYWGEEADYQVETYEGFTTDEELAVKSCPHYEGISRPLKLGVAIGTPPNTHVTSFIFDGEKPFVAYEQTGTATRVAKGLFGPVMPTLSEDLHYVASGLLGVSCNGKYYRNLGFRLWTGTLLTYAVQYVASSNLTGPGGEEDECRSSYLYDPYYADCDNAGAGSGGSRDDDPNCHEEYIWIEISYDGGATWQPYWEGWATVCDGQQAT